ncbi:hypothetical protein T8T21_03910 [Limimaricola variabilis]|uniref:hypothetical protein n=1 Tax=Limimaricola variabilis TaxID=1492771 RepID=UPI002AC8F44D|nr:hypothetical protein [Limimaricola variabilis]WPY95281.1 hypothetical protein T8T21_03910 [Limimaricola variabilis]
MVDQVEIEAALQREIATREVPSEDSEIRTERFVKLAGKPGSKEEAFFAGRGWAGEDIGLYAFCRLVHAKQACPDARPPILP